MGLSAQNADNNTLYLIRCIYKVDVAVSAASIWNALPHNVVSAYSVELVVELCVIF